MSNKNPKIEFKIENTSRGLTEENIVDLWHSVGWYNGSAMTPDKLLKGLQNSNISVIWDENILVGLCSAIDDGALNAWISYMVVRPEYQNLSLGSALLKDVLKKYKGFRIFVQTTNAKRFYERNGFSEEMHSMKMLN